MESYWITSAPATAYPSLTEDTRADVAVIGAGIAGLCTAWGLLQRGRSVILIDSGRIVEATTGHTTAKLTAQHGLIYERLRSSLGATTARTYARCQLDALEWVGRTADALGIDCDLERRAAITYVTEEAQVDQVRAEVDAARAAGLPASFVTETGLPFPVAGAIRVEDQWQFHPRRFLIGLAEAFVRDGGRIVEQTRVVDVDGTRVRTGDGPTVTADDVVVATQFPIVDRIRTVTRMTPRREFVVAAPIPSDRDPDGMYLTTEDGTRSVRTAPYRDGQRLLIVTGEHFTPGTGSASERLGRLTEWARDTLGMPAPTYQWAAQDFSTTDGVPFIGRLDDHLWVGTGFAGWGMSNGVVTGSVLTELITGNRPQWTEIFDPGRLHPSTEAVPLVKAGLTVVSHAVGDRLRRPGSPRDLAPGEGAVLRIGARQCAVYRDADGTLSAVSATCTHLGCVVGFNDAERTWDCPCHGSRFGLRGEVIHGPAVRPLPPEDLSGVD